MAFDIKENLKKLPETPGVYLHKDKLGQVIYVGKAVNLKRRVSSYFINSASHSQKVKSMVEHIAEFETINAATEMEALILECNLIKKYEPKYNVLLRDDKTYPYMKITNEEYPRLVKTRVLAKDGARYFGPYSDVGAVNSTIELLNKSFRLKRCSARSFPEDFRPCLNYHIGECRGICTGKVGKEEYSEAINEVNDFLNGKTKPLISDLKEKMEKAAEEMNFEEAAGYRDSINAIESLSSVQRVSMVSGKDMDMVLPVGEGENTSVVLFLVRGGKLSGRETFAMASEGDMTYDDIVGGFIKQYYINLALPPQEILVTKELKEAELIGEYISKKHKVRIFVPERGEKRALLDLAKRDVIEMSKTLDVRIRTQQEKEDAIRDTLCGILGVRKDVYRVESYDISNTNGVDTVGAMVVYKNLKAVKKDYRRFRIRTVNGPDDYGALREMLERRFRRAMAGDDGFKELPDLILMDGGRGQVTTAEKAIRSVGFEVPVLGMAKDDSHRTRALVDGLGEEILLKDYPLMFRYCGTIQEEVHRFAIEYHRSLHSRNSIGSILDEIPGIGPKKRTALLTHFKTIDDIKKAEVSELMETDGVSRRDAESVYAYFRKNS